MPPTPVILPVYNSLTCSNWLDELARGNNFDYTKCWFHQHITRAFFADILSPTSLKAERFSFVIFGTKLLTKNAHVKCWWNWHQVSISWSFCAFGICVRKSCLWSVDEIDTKWLVVVLNVSVLKWNWIYIARDHRTRQKILFPFPFFLKYCMNEKLRIEFENILH